MVRRVLTMWLALALLAATGSRGEAEDGVRPFWTPDEIRSTASGDAGLRCVAGAVSNDQAKINARLIEWAGNNMHVTGKTLVFPAGKMWQVADDNSDGIDIHWHDVSGLSVTTESGGTQRRFAGDVGTGPANAAEGTIVHVGDIGDTVVQLSDFQFCEIDLNIRGSYATTLSQANTQFSTSDWWDTPTEAIDPEAHQMAGCGLCLHNEDNTSSSGKSIISGSFTQCYRAVDVTSVADAGPDGVYFPWLGWRYCHYGIRVNADQMLDFHMANVWSSGSRMQRGIEFLRGGNLIVDAWFGSPGVNLYVGPNVATNASQFDIRGFRGDGNVVSANSFVLVDSEKGIGSLRGRITGSFTEAADHQVVRVKHQKPGLSDWQIDIHGLGNEEGAYPLRPTRGQWIYKRHQPTMASSTVFFIEADRDTPTGHTAAGSGWTVDPSTLIVSAADDLSASNNDVVNDGTDPKVTRGEVNCRDAVGFGASICRLVDKTPTGVGSSFDALTVDITVKPVNVNGATNYIFSCRDVDSTDGWAVTMDGTYHVGFSVGSEAAVFSDATLEPERVSRIVCTRDKVAGEWKIIVDGVEKLFSGKATTTIPAVNGAIAIGQQQSGSGSTWGNSFEGHVAVAAVDEAILTGSDKTARDAYMRQFGGY